MATAENVADRLAQLALFSDLTHAQLDELVQRFDEEVFSEGRRILREGMTGAGLYVILDGEAAVVIHGEERARFGRGDVFGEVSVLLASPPTADVVALTRLRCLVIPAPDLKPFLMARPSVMFRLLQTEARRLATTLQWLS
jgi:CRP-like cAMP-binding protein